MYLTKQHFKSIVPENKTCNRFSASNEFICFLRYILNNHIMCMETFPLTKALIYRRHIIIDVTTLYSVDKKVIVPGAGHYRYIVPSRLTNDFPRIYDVLHLDFI